MKAVIIIAALVFAVCNFGRVFAVDPCILVPDSGNTEWYGGLSPIKQCWDNIPFSSQRQSDTLSRLRQLVDLYAFTDIVKNSSAPWNMQVDLDAGLEEITNKEYLGDYAFHADLANLFGKLNDAHTLYAFPAPYSSVIVVRPFGIQIVNDNGLLKFYVSESYFADTAKLISLFNFDPTPYYGYELTAIDGIPILEWFQQFVDKFVGTYKDQPIRFNGAIQLYGSFNIFDCAYFSIYDLADSAVMTINGTDVEAPYMAIFNGGVTSTEDAITKIDTPISKKRSGPTGDQPDIHRERKADLTWLKPANANNENNRKRFDYASLNTQAVQKRSDLQAAEQYILSVKTGVPANIKVFDRSDDDAIWWGMYTTADGEQVPYLRIESFSPYDRDNFTAILTKFSNHVSTNQIDRIIVDVSGNGGGKICLAYQSTTIFSATFRGVNNYELYDLRRTESNSDLVSGGVLSGLDYIKVSTGREYTDESWYNSRTVTRGGQQTSLSQRFYFPSDCLDVMDSINVTHFPADPIIITDGTCGSSCSLFVSKFVENNVGRVFTYGGFPGVTMDTSSFGGGNVEDWADFVAYSIQFDLINPPQPPTTSAWYRFTHHEMYSGTTSQLPREFRFMPGQYHAYYYDWFTSGGLSTTSGKQALADLYETAVTAWTLPAPVAVPISPPIADVPQAEAPVATAPVAKPPVSTKVSLATSVFGQSLLLSLVIALTFCMHV